MANTTWSTTDLNQITLSGGNLTATSTGSSGAVRAVNSQRTGKYYVEYTMSTWGNAFSQPGFTANTNPSGGTNAVVVKNGHIYINGVDSGSSLGALASGNVIGVAIDLTNNNIWFRVAPSGNWNGSGTANPATNTGGISISALSANGMAPVVQLIQTGDVCAANFGNSAFTGAVPASFTGGFPAPVLNFTTWNPADLLNVVLTMNSQTVSVQSTLPAGGVRSVASKSTGKYYWEYVWSQFSNGTTTLVGVANASAPLGSVAGTVTNSCGVQPNGAIWLNGGSTGSSLGTRASGDIIGVAVDVGGGLIWFRVAPSGNWNGSSTANPATGAGGISISVLSIPLYAVVGNPSGPNIIVTADFGDSPFVGAVPIGFTAGLPAAPPNYVDFAGNIGSVSLYGKALYGQKLYSQGGAFAPVIAGDINLVGQQYFVGNLAPVVTFNGKVGFDFQFVGGIAPIVTFAGNLVLNEVLVGGIAPQITLGASLSVIVALNALEGSFGVNVALGASNLISGPLWAETAPCPPSLWTPTEPCDPVEWQKAELCHG